MPRIQNPGVVERLRRFVGSRGPFEVDTIAPEIVAVAVAADLTDADEGGRFIAFVGSSESGALAANYSHCQLWNPLAGVDVVVTCFHVTFSAITGFKVYAWGAALGGISGGSTPIDFPGVPDFGFGVAAQHVAQLRTYQNTAVSGTNIIGRYANSPSYQSRKIDFSARITPGWGIHVVPDNVNVASWVTWHWKEVPRVQ